MSPPLGVLPELHRVFRGDVARGLSEQTPLVPSCRNLSSSHQRIIELDQIKTWAAACANPLLTVPILNKKDGWAEAERRIDDESSVSGSKSANKGFQRRSGRRYPLRDISIRVDAFDAIVQSRTQASPSQDSSATHTECASELDAARVKRLPRLLAF